MWWVPCTRKRILTKQEIKEVKIVAEIKNTQRKIGYKEFTGPRGKYITHITMDGEPFAKFGVGVANRVEIDNDFISFYKDNVMLIMFKK